MQRLIPVLDAERPWRILCLGAHGDDLEIGCGGTILRLLAEHRRVEVAWCVLTASDEREAECRQSAGVFLAGVEAAHIEVKRFRDGFLPYEGAAVKEFFEQLKRQFSPDLIFTHGRQDLHQDHRLIADMTWNTFRNHLILEYEIPKYDADLGSPNFFVPLSAETCRRKIGALLKEFPSQADRRWFTEETFMAILRLRGIECQSPTGYAEGFHCRKIVV